MRTLLHAARGAALAAAALLAPAFGAEGHGQLPVVTPFWVEARTGLALPVEMFGDDVVGDGGWVSEVAVGFQPLPFVGLYGSYAWAEFGDEDGEGSFTDRGLAAGVRVNVPTPLIPIDPWIRGGVVAHTLDADAAPGTSDDPRGVGVELGGGLSFRLTNRVSLTPGITWTRYGVEDDAGDELSVEYLRADIGARLRI